MKFRFTAEVECEISWEVEVQREKLKPEMQELSEAEIAHLARDSFLDSGGMFEADLKEKLGLTGGDSLRVSDVRVKVL